MATTTLDAIVDQLQTERSHLSKEADEIRTRLASLEANVGRIDSGLAALAGTPANGKPNAKRQLTKPSANKSQVTDLITDALSKEQVIALDELKKGVENRLVETGHSLIGFSLRFKEALADPQFVSTPSGIRLKTESVTSGVSFLTTKGTSTNHSIHSSPSGSNGPATTGVSNTEGTSITNGTTSSSSNTNGPCITKAESKIVSG